MATDNKKQQRIAILKDALLRVNMGDYDARCGILIDSDGLDDAISRVELTGLTTTIEAKKFITNFLKEDSCLVCARGALLLSTVTKYNDCTINQLKILVDDGGKTNTKLRKFFTTRQINMMEAAFEGYNFNSEVLSNKDNEACESFYDSFSEAEDRLRAIFTNAIKNGGEFKP